MNKIFKSGGRWQVLKKRVSPVVIAFQALLATGCTVLVVLLFEYRPETGTPVVRDFRYTSYFSSGNSQLRKLSGELDPAAFTREKNVPIPQFPLQEMVKIKLLRPEKVLPAMETPGAAVLPVTAVGFYPDHRTVPANYGDISAPEAVAVMYDESGRELARWASSGKPQKEMTILQIDGTGALQHSRIMVSCGDPEMDKKALARVTELRLDNGIYSVWYPDVKQEI